MKYIKMTFQYLTPKKFLLYFLLALVPAFPLATLSNRLTFVQFLMDYYHYDNMTMDLFINSIFGHFQWWIIIIGIIIMTIFVAIIFGTLERDLHIGDFKLQHIFRRINRNFITCIVCVSILFASLLLYKLLTAAITVFYFSIIPEPFRIVMVILNFIFMYTLLLFVFSAFLIMPPMAVNTGMNIFSCVSQTLMNVKGKIWSLFVAILFGGLIKLVAIQIFGFLGTTLNLIVDILFNALLIVYYTTLMFIAYYDIQDIERGDLANKIRW